MTDAESKPQVSGTTPEETNKTEGNLPPLNIFLHWCKGCNICIAYCPNKVLEPDRDGKPILAHPEKCTQCAICWLHCPDFAITSNYK
ncbi:conserved hypothetical protein [Candidatus Zixiibacteriota bacterium]|nr:conserved hypothetical protein [candidate division Zixibacteria bacterium]